jgi:hypothetical protein
MSENGGNGEGGGNLGKIPHELLIDELVLTMDRGDGTMKIGGKVLNSDVALDMIARAQRYFETLLRIEAVAQVKQQALDAQRTAEILSRTRGGRG